MRRNAKGLVILGALALALLTARAPAALAQKSEASQAKKQFQLGWAALQAERYSVALEHYRRSYTLVPRPRTLFNIAVSEEKLGRINDAVRHYAEFLDVAQARDHEFLLEAKRKIKALSERRTGTLQVISDPPGASVFVGGRLAVGTTPMKIELRVGPHKLRLALEGAKPVTRTVTISGQRNATERFSLTLSSTVVITVDPPGAQIRGARDERLAPATGEYRRVLRPGKHKFTITLDGFRAQTVSVRAQAGRVHERHVKLLGLGGTGSLRIRSGIAGATVSIDGLVVGTTATDGSGAELHKQVPSGDHDVLVERDGAQRWHRRLHVSPGETISVELAFRDTHVSRTKLLGWGLAGLGTVSIAAAGTLGVLALRDVSSTDTEDHGRGKSRALLSDLLLVGGAAAILSAWHLSKRPKTTARVRRAHEGN